MPFRDMDLNHHIRFKLSPNGERIWRKYWETYCGASDPLLNIPADADGWRKEQMWMFANVFGGHLANDFDPPVETAIQVETDD